MNKLLRVLILLSLVVIFNKSYSQDCNAMPSGLIGNFEDNNLMNCGWEDLYHTSIFYNFSSPAPIGNTSNLFLIQSPINNNHAVVLTPNNPDGNDCGYPIMTSIPIDVFVQNTYTLKFNYINTRAKELIIKVSIFDYNANTSSTPPLITQDITISIQNTEWQLSQFNFTPPYEGKIRIAFSACYEDGGYSSNDDYIGLDNVELIYYCGDNDEGGENDNPIVDDSTIIEECKDCSSFKPLAGEKYIVSGWARLMQQAGTGYQKINTFNYENVYIGVSYFDQNNTIIGSEDKIYPLGEIIDGWQRIQSEIMIPNESEEIKISLVNENAQTVTAFFDDIRVHPFNGNLKSFVYDQETQKLMAELDENNYATFYEYDKEGGLVRVKKETEKGVFTIQETRSSTFKK